MEPKRYKFTIVLLVSCLFLGLGAAFFLSAGFHQFLGKEIAVIDDAKVIEKQSPPLRPISAEQRLKVAVGAMISPKNTAVYYSQLLSYLGRSLGMEVELVQRKTYAEINTLLISGDIHIAFICSGPYAIDVSQQGLSPLATPIVQGKHLYHSYLIVKNDCGYSKLEDLRGKSFAFTDPDSNTGSIVPRYWLAKAGTDAKEYFSNIIFTYSHDNSILAVGKGLVDGAAVDSLIWDYYASKDSDFTGKTRIIKRSEGYGIPPVVASSRLPEEQRKRLQATLLSMHKTPEGAAILKELLIDRFVVPQEDWYSSIREMHSFLNITETVNDATPKKP
ncbi:MAG: phosphate/phosphite/phosphonate ABC transporter substrate-binding protein [Desulfovibrio sp.]|nr:phosphate/phosphite/phosphonate ABC transporter substrate-binding protein [Desulfovibrio sp.]